ncbi:MAG TPA: ferrochelatase [Woeseiaceae bacterium]|nr:ferrochelatase [Woeseiaceae bacterium]
MTPLVARETGSPAVHDGGETLGVLVVNLGTPDAPTPAALRRYLRQFLSDTRVVELPPWLWFPVLHGFVLRVRPARSAAMYRQIWTERGSPLLFHSLDLARALQAALTQRLDRRVVVELGMSYGKPSIDSALQKLEEQGAGRIVALPLYPQYAASTTGSAFDRLARALAARRRVPGVTFIDQYHDETGYIAAIAGSVREFRERYGRGERLLFSFHGLPRRMVEKGDPYAEQCRTTAKLVAEALGLGQDEWEVAFQSRVGRQAWLEPYTEDTIASWGRKGMQKVDAVCPGFAVDCLETLEEVRLRYAEAFNAAGGGELRYIPALNERPEHVEFLGGLIARYAPDTSGNRPEAPRAPPGPPRIDAGGAS